MGIEVRQYDPSDEQWAIPLARQAQCAEGNCLATMPEMTDEAFRKWVSLRGRAVIVVPGRAVMSYLVVGDGRARVGHVVIDNRDDQALDAMIEYLRAKHGRAFSIVLVGSHGTAGQLERIGYKGDLAEDGKWIRFERDRGE